MPYFLKISIDGIAVQGVVSEQPPTVNHVSGTIDNFLQRWDGSKFVDTDDAKKFRQQQKLDAIELAKMEEDRPKRELSDKQIIARLKRIEESLDKLEQI